MNPYRAKENQKKWDKFLSTIKTEKKEQHTQPIIITDMKDGIQCLAYNFSRQLLADSDSTVTVTGRKEYISTITDRTDISETFLPIKKSKSFPVHNGTPLLTGSDKKRRSCEMQTSNAHKTRDESKYYGHKRNLLFDDIGETSVKSKQAKYKSDDDIELSNSNNPKFDMTKTDPEIVRLEVGEVIEPVVPNKPSDNAQSRNEKQAKQTQHELKTNFNATRSGMHLPTHVQNGGDIDEGIAFEEKNQNGRESYKDLSIDDIKDINSVRKEFEIIDVDLTQDNEIEDRELIEKTDVGDKGFIGDILKEKHVIKIEEDEEKEKAEDEVMNIFKKYSTQSTDIAKNRKESDFGARRIIEDRVSGGRPDDHIDEDEALLPAYSITHGYTTTDPVFYKREVLVDEAADVRDVELMRKDTMQADDIEKQVKDTLTVKDEDGLTEVIPDNYDNETRGILDMKKRKSKGEQTSNVNSRGVMKAERDENQGNDIIEIKEEDGAAKVTQVKLANGTRGLDMNMSDMRHITDVGYKKSSGDSRSLNFAKKEKYRSKMKEEEEVKEVVPHLTSKISAQSVGSIEGDVSIKRTRERNVPSPKKVKKGIDTSCSQWKMDLFSNYFDFDSTVTPLSIQAISSPQKDATRVQRQIKEEVIKRCKIMFGNNSAETTKDFFKGMRSNETTVRILLDAIFLTLCSSLGYNIEVGKNIKSAFLVPCVFDYRILHKGNVIGSIEAKSSEGLKKESIIQAVLQLTILQAEIIQKGAESPPPLFNIVTDGVRFIFIQLKGEKLGFEHNHLSKLHINRVESITDLEELLPKLVALVQMSEGCTSAKAFDNDEVLDLT